ncbi:DNA polymerase II small subunit [uncultured archaeon]|nr:DNA polymerase II small subunit [uncultured archaeon]
MTEDKESELRKAITGTFRENGLLIAASSLDRIIAAGVNPKDVVEEAKKEGLWIIAEDFILRFIKTDEELTEIAGEIGDAAELPVSVVKTKHSYAKDVAPQIRIREDTDITDKSSSDGTMQNFVDYFNNKYERLGSILKERPNYRTAVTVEALKKLGKTPEPQRIIVMVTEKRESKKGNKFFEAEDPTGQITVYVKPGERRLEQAYNDIMLDEVIGVEGVLSNNLFVAREITEPDLPISHPEHRSEEPVCVAYLSDTHVGSYLFLEKQFKAFIEWLKGSGNRKELSEAIKYVIIAGDLVDGIGVYPSQEKELTLPDINKQYAYFTDLVAQIPNYIEVIISVGNHDAVRRAEPQPKLPHEIAEGLEKLPNVHLVGNPVYADIHGVSHLIYHGTTLDTVIGSFADCSYKNPEKAMTHYLRKRHLAPVYGNDNLLPTTRDYMAINEIPDVLHCGHVHTNGYGNYRGVRIINSGTWQARTKYQEMLGHQPTPAHMPVLNLQNMEFTLLHFE